MVGHVLRWCAPTLLHYPCSSLLQPSDAQTISPTSSGTNRGVGTILERVAVIVALVKIVLSRASIAKVTYLGQFLPICWPWEWRWKFVRNSDHYWWIIDMILEYVDIFNFALVFSWRVYWMNSGFPSVMINLRLRNLAAWSEKLKLNSTIQFTYND